MRGWPAWWDADRAAGRAPGAAPPARLVRAVRRSGPAALHDLKYAGERRLAEPLGVAVARRWARVGVGAEVVVPVPVHADRGAPARLRPGRAHRRRGGARLGLPLAVALERSRATVAQFELGRDERAANVAGAFAIRRRRRRPTGAHRRPLGPAHRRRGHDRVDAGGLCRRRSSGPARSRSRRSPSHASADPVVPGGAGIRDRTAGPGGSAHGIGPARRHGGATGGDP